MRKPVLIGAGLGFLVLALVAGGFWMAGNSQPSIAGPDLKTTARNKATLLQEGGVSAQPSIGHAASAQRSTKESQERRRRLAELRAEFNALRAQGTQAPPEKMRAIVNELEALSPPGMILAITKPCATCWTPVSESRRSTTNCSLCPRALRHRIRHASRRSLPRCELLESVPVRRRAIYRRMRRLPHRG